MKKKGKYIFFGMVICAFVGVSTFFVVSRGRFAKESLPPAVQYESVQTVQENGESPKEQSPLVTEEINLNVPFTSQAPHQDWQSPYGEFCEEASVLMADGYVNNRPIENADDADARLHAIKDFEMTRFGFYEDTNVAQTAIILNEYFGLHSVDVKHDPTVDDIKKALAQGKVILVPLAGRRIGNPYYRQPGPLYHMLVVKGYTKNNRFITNDPGTRRGADYTYGTDVIMRAIHDWNGGNVDDGEKVILIVG